MHWFNHVSADLIIEDVKRNLFDKVPAREVNKALVMSARILIEKEPNYTYVAARLLLDDLRHEALNFLDLNDNTSATEMKILTPTYFEAYLECGIEL